jgi:3-hydroxyisobutyrate dehydrogenase
MKEGSYLIDHTTSSPGLALKIYQEAKKRSIYSIDAPVSGGDIGAKNGKLVTMVGGEKDAYEAVSDLLKCYSLEIQLMGEAGSGQHTKMANQIFIANNMIGVCEGLIYGHKAGLDLNQLITLLSKGAAGSFSLEKLGPRMLRRDFDPGFYVEHFVKDLGIALEEARRMQLGLPGLALASQFYQALIAHGGARMGTQGLLTTIELFNNTTVKKYDI